MESYKLYKSLVMEIRPRLQSVNVYVTLVEPSTVGINLNLDNFELIIGSAKHQVQCDSFYIVPDSLSCFSNKENYVTFRFATENVQQQLGTSRFEIVEINKQTSSVSNLEISIKPAISYSIRCYNCTQPFCKEVVFERVLPLPDSSDSSEWFCHAHDNCNEAQTLVPKTNELFFSHCFVHLDENVLAGFLEERCTLICRRCLAWIGVILKSKLHKVWLNTVTFNDKNNDFNSAPLNDSFKTIGQILNTSLLSSVRIVLTCQSSSAQIGSILLWILEKKLRVSFDGDYKINDDVCKVLFKYEENQTDLVSQWIRDINVSTVDISKPMMVKLLEHLYDMNRYIPKDFSASNNFYISYLMLYTENFNK